MGLPKTKTFGGAKPKAEREANRRAQAHREGRGLWERLTSYHNVRTADGTICISGREQACAYADRYGGVVEYRGEIVYRAKQTGSLPASSTIKKKGQQ